MSYSSFSSADLVSAVDAHFAAIENSFRRHYDDLSHEDNMVGALQILLTEDSYVSRLQETFQKLGYRLDIDFIAKKDPSEPQTGVDLSLLLKIYTHPMQSVENYRDYGFYARNSIKKSLLVQTKNLRTDYGVNVRRDQLRNIVTRSENGGVVWFLSRKGIEIASANDLIDSDMRHYADVPGGLKYDFSVFMRNFFETNVGDHDPRLFSAIESGKLSDFVRYRITPSALSVSETREIRGDND